MKYLKKISLNTIESYLGNKIKKNQLAIGFDSAQHKTGIAILRTTDNYLVLEKTSKIEVPKDIHELDAMDLFTEQLDILKKELMMKYKFDLNLIENCYIGLNPKTGIWLARSGVLLYDRIKSLSKVSKLRYPSTARRLIGFKKSSKKVKGAKLKKELMIYISELLNFKIDDSDIADSVILCLSGLINVKENR